MSDDYEYDEEYIEIEEELNELRGRRWRRDRNRVTARRKFGIYVENYYAGDREDTKRPEHYFVKGKCHCSCTGCSIHTNAKHSRKQVYYGMWTGGTMNYKHGEMMNHLEMKDRLREYTEEAA